MNSEKRRRGEDESPDENKASEAALSHEAYTVGWVCALPKEQTAAIAMLDQRHPNIPKMQPPTDTNAYTLGSIGGHNVVIACLPKGQTGVVSAATVATNMVSTFSSIKIGLMVGIGGGVPSNKVRLGDVVVSTPTGKHPGVVQWDLGKVKGGGTFERTGSLNNPPTFLLTALTKVESKHEMDGPKFPRYLDELKQKWPKLADRYLRSEGLRDVLFKADCIHVDADTSSSDEDEEPYTCLRCDRTKAKERRLRECRIHWGLIASGSMVIKDGIFRDKLNADLGGSVLCIEMEAAGLITNFPCLVIRGICDYADSHKNNAWQEHAAAVASAFAKEILEYLEPESVKEERSIKIVLQGIEDKMLVVQNRMDQLQVRTDRGENVDILKWLTPISYGAEQSDFLARHQPGTAQWFLRSESFERWMSSEGTTLFCPGIQGSGKTIITSLVVDTVDRSFDGLKGMGLAYIYFNYNAHKHQRRQDVLASIIQQLCQSTDALPNTLRNLHKKHARRLTQPSLEELLETLISVAASLSRVFIIVDGLDECQVADDCHARLLKHLQKIQLETKANIFITSRPTSEVESIFTGCLRQKIEAKASDVDKYVGSRLPKVLQSTPEGPHLGTIIQGKVMRLSDGMFLLAQLYMDALQDATSAAEVRETLNEIESQAGEKTEDDGCNHMLTKAYDHVMGRINDQPSKSRNLAMKALSWVLYAKKPLTTAELQHALAVKEVDTVLDCENIRPIGLILSVCAGLVTIGENSDIIRLAHETTQTYLKSAERKHFPNFQSEITTICVSYLTFHGFSRPPWGKDEWEIGERLPLTCYAASYWGEHAREAGKNQSVDIERFLRDDISVSIACDYMTRIHDKLILQPERTWKALHLAAFYGLAVEVENLVNAGFDPNVVSETNITPLMVASARGFEDVVNLLLSKGANIQARSSFLQTSLIFASTVGHRTLVKILLLNGADVTVEPYSRALLEYPDMILCHGGLIDVLSEVDAQRGVDSYGGYLARLNMVDLMVNMLIGWGSRIQDPTFGPPPVMRLDPFYGA